MKMYPDVMYPAMPQRDFDGEERALRRAIADYERLAKAVWKILPCFVPDGAIQRMGFETIATIFEDFHRDLRAHCCDANEEELARLSEQRINPTPYEPPNPKPPTHALSNYPDRAAQVLFDIGVETDSWTNMYSLKAERDTAQVALVKAEQTIRDISIIVLASESGFREQTVLAIDAALARYKESQR